MKTTTIDNDNNNDFVVFIFFTITLRRVNDHHDYVILKWTEYMFNESWLSYKEMKRII